MRKYFEYNFDHAKFFSNSTFEAEFIYGVALNAEQAIGCHVGETQSNKLPDRL